MSRRFVLVRSELMDDFAAVSDILKKCIQLGGSVSIKIGMGMKKSFFLRPNNFRQVPRNYKRFVIRFRR